MIPTSAKRLLGKQKVRRAPLYFFQIPIPGPQKYFLGNLETVEFNSLFAEFAEEPWIDVITIDRYGVQRVSSVKNVVAETLKHNRPLQSYFCTEEQYKQRMRNPEPLKHPWLRYISVVHL